jgi:hypothetical protein
VGAFPISRPSDEIPLPVIHTGLAGKDQPKPGQYQLGSKRSKNTEY